MNRSRPLVASVVLAAALSMTAVGDAVAEEGIVSEVKLGVFLHDIDFLPEGYEDGEAVNAEILFRSPFPQGERWSFRPHLGGSIALEGETDQIYAGLTLTYYPFDGTAAPLWFSAFGGGALHDGKLDTDNRDDKSLGSRVLFRFGGEIGWDVTENFSVSLHYSHISNAYLAHPNEGLEHGGIRVGWRF